MNRRDFLKVGGGVAGGAAVAAALAPFYVKATQVGQKYGQLDEVWLNLGTSDPSPLQAGYLWGRSDNINSAPRLSWSPDASIVKRLAHVDAALADFPNFPSSFTPSAHKSTHVSGGSDAFVKTDVLVAASRYLEAIADPASDAQRIWLNGLRAKLWDNQVTPTLHSLAYLDDSLNSFTGTGRATSGQLPTNVAYIDVAQTFTAAQLFKPTADSVTAFRVQKSDASAIFDVDTTNKRVGIGTETPGQILDVQGAIRVNRVVEVDSSVALAMQVGHRGAQPLQFFTNNTVAWLIDSSQHLQPNVDNAFDSGQPTLIPRRSFLGSTFIRTATKTANYTITDTDGLGLISVSASGGPRTITLPAASTNSGRRLTIIKKDSSVNGVTVARAGADTIEGATSIILGTQYGKAKLVSDGVSLWYDEGTGLN